MGELPAANQTALMMALINAPAGGGARTWEGTGFQLSIDGVVMNCTYGQQYTDGVFSLSCVAPSPGN